MCRVLVRTPQVQRSGMLLECVEMRYEVSRMIGKMLGNQKVPEEIHFACVCVMLAIVLGLGIDENLVDSPSRLVSMGYSERSTIDPRPDLTDKMLNCNPPNSHARA